MIPARNLAPGFFSNPKPPTLTFHAVLKLGEDHIRLTVGPVNFHR